MYICVRALLKLCDLLRCLYACGVTHGDVHAGNVMVVLSDEDEVDATLLDFGLAERCSYTDAARQMDDVSEVVTAALQVISSRRELSSVRWNLQVALYLGSVYVTDYLTDAL